MIKKICNFIKSKKIISLIIIIILLLLVLSLVYFLGKKDTNKGQELIDGKYIKSGEYYFDTSANAYDPNILIRTSDAIKKEHCLDNICLSDVVIKYTRENEGYVQSTVTNKSKSKQSGYVKMDFGDDLILLVSYNLKPNESDTSYSIYNSLDLNNVVDYKLIKVSESEEKKYSKK